MTTSGLELSAASSHWCIRVIRDTPILLTPYAVCGQPSSWWLPFCTSLKRTTYTRLSFLCAHATLLSFNCFDAARWLSNTCSNYRQRLSHGKRSHKRTVQKRPLKWKLKVWTLVCSIPYTISYLYPCAFQGWCVTKEELTYMIYTHVTNFVMKPLSSAIVVQALSSFLNSALQRSIAILLAMLDTFTTLQVNNELLCC